MTWLTSPDGIALAALPSAPPVPGPYPQQPAGLPIADNGEPLATIPASLATLPVYRRLGLSLAPPTMYLRTGVIDRLTRAQQLLPTGFSLLLLDGWRTRTFQAQLVAHYRSTPDAVADGFLSDPASTTLIPRHTTGGAVDLTLAWHGTPLALGTDFDAFTSAASLDWYERQDEDIRVRRLRRILARALRATGFAHYPPEWWHWSYGDQQWAAYSGSPCAMYGEAHH